MNRLFSAYGKLVLGILTATIAIGLLTTGAYMGTSGLTTNGIMPALGKEASIKQEDTAKNRTGPELANMSTAPASTKLNCSGVIMQEGVQVEVSDLFSASNADGVELPVRILHVTDDSGKELINNADGDIILADNILIVNKSGMYHFTVRATAEKSVTKIFDIYVSPKPEEEEGDLL